MPKVLAKLTNEITAIKERIINLYLKEAQITEDLLSVEKKSPKITEKAKERCRILAFWERHGTEATKEAFKISRRTLFRWQKALKERGGQLEGLNALSKAPHHKKQRKPEQEAVQRIIKLRTLYPRIGKEKIHALEREVADLRTKINYQRLPTVKEVVAKTEAPPQPVSAVSTEKKESHPRLGNYEGNDVSIEKFLDGVGCQFVVWTLRERSKL